MLSILRSGPMHGYELKRRVQRPSSVPLSNNSLYPALRRFEAAGLVTSAVEEQQGKPDRTVYSLTDAGRRHLTELLSTLPLELANDEEEFLVRVSFFGEIAPANRRAILAARLAAVDAAIAQVGDLLDPSSASVSREWRALTMGKVLERLHDERAWISELEQKALQP